MFFTLNLLLYVLIYDKKISYSFAAEDFLPVERLDENVSLIIVGFRHGARNPSKFLNFTNRQFNEWGWEGEGELTNVKIIGKMESFLLGRFLRASYANLLPADYLPSQITATSSSSKRCQMTLMSVMAGLFPPSARARWNQMLPWQPIPFDINDPLLRMFNVECPKFKKTFKPIEDDSLQSTKDLLSKESDLINYIVANTGVNASLKDLNSVADNVDIMIRNELSLPAWIEQPTLEYNTTDIVSAILQYTRAHEKQCANDKQCARCLAGLWLHTIVGILKQKNDGKLPDMKAQFFATHIHVVLSLVKLIGVEENVTNVPTSGGFVLELKSTGTEKAVRLRLVGPVLQGPFPRVPNTPGHRTVRFHFCPNQDWCPLDAFIENVKNEAVENWEEFCQLVPKTPENCV